MLENPKIIRVFGSTGMALWAHASLHLWDPQLGRDDRWACPPFDVITDPRLVPWWAWQEVKGEAMAVTPM